MADTPIFDQNAYWIERHERLRDDPRSVGNLGKSLEENRSAETVMRHWVGQAAKLLKPYGSVIDVGCGYGRVAGAFCDAGYAYTGVDISPTAIASARILEPRGTYRVQSALGIEDADAFDLACVLYVFVHFVDDKDWNDLIAVLVRSLTSGGGLLFADEFPIEKQASARHATHRPLSLYEEMFRSHGMRIDPGFRQNLVAALGTAVGKLPPVYLARKVK